MSHPSRKASDAWHFTSLRSAVQQHSATEHSTAHRAPGLDGWATGPAAVAKKSAGPKPRSTATHPVPNPTPVVGHHMCTIRAVLHDSRHELDHETGAATAQQAGISATRQWWRRARRFSGSHRVNVDVGAGVVAAWGAESHRKEGRGVDLKYGAAGGDDDGDGDGEQLLRLRRMYITTHGR
ncbi:hypothetical protein AK830_g8479 [Neonectria ditissima]|uniref:Uncharacterized protein n=1 Tax=Neonectria ditissima TaxID=78410 RepID=A0A0P7AX98_9HYPO|nr:hypothetical protein AK830_g8479 [Neonectria ditissima]